MYSNIKIKVHQTNSSIHQYSLLKIYVCMVALVTDRLISQFMDKSVLGYKVVRKINK